MERKILKNHEKITFKVRDLVIGGEKPIIIAGPCSVESREQVIETAKALKAIGVDMLRGGVFKPRTSPYAFQGLGIEGLEYLKEASEITGLPIITECMEEKYLDIVSEYADIIQIGSRNMYNYPLLKALRAYEKPVMLKRGFSATIKEWIMSAEYLAAEGKKNIILCERGVRSVDNYTRNLLDLTAVPIMQHETGLPVFVDPSHGIGIRELILPMSKAAIACGADGVMIEVHINPDEALCDGEQSLTIEQYKAVYEALRG
ncbi:MAG: 3-deoxy-7-phosphoheptulonate synthase [Clostridia bacterium]|nr:3-deoxy-7-phosphoheptulonate synthase [Clostridia bacterium]